MTNKPISTRWQLRVEPELEKVIRDFALITHRSINHTCIYLIEASITYLKDKELESFKPSEK